MPINIKKLLVSINKKRFLAYASLILVIYLYFFLVLLIPIENDPSILHLQNLPPIISLPLLLVLAITSVIIINLILNSKMFAPTSNENLIFQYTFKYDTYFTLTSFFVMTLGAVLFTFGLISNPLLQIGIILFQFGLILYLTTKVIIVYYENKLYYSLKKANKILQTISIDKRDKHKIKTFTNFFKSALGNIDTSLYKGLQLNDFKIHPHNTVTIKNVITYYLPLYIIFGDKDHLDSLKTNVDSMFSKVKINDEFELSLTKDIINICNDVDTFLKNNSISYKDQGWKSKLAVLKDINLTSLAAFIQVLVYIIIYYKQTTLP